MLAFITGKRCNLLKKHRVFGKAVMMKCSCIYLLTCGRDREDVRDKKPALRLRNGELDKIEKNDVMNSDNNHAGRLNSLTE